MSATLSAQASTGSPDNRAVHRAEIAGVSALGLLAAGILWWRWVGYQGHDDTSYAAAALDWVRNFPALGTDHWALRYPLVLPAAAAIALFGPSVPALAAVNVIAYAAFLVVNYLAARHWFGWGTAVLLTLIGIVLPQFPVQATYANPDLLEMTLTTASFWALMLARERGGTWGTLLLSGVLAGIGFLTRETSLLLVILYGLLFLFRPAMPRWRYLLIALGFIVVVGAEAGYFTARTGDPLYRTRLSATHDVVDRSAKLTQAESAGRALDSEGVLASSAFVAPFAAVFVSQKYGLLFFLAIPAYALLRAGRRMTPRQRSVVDCAGLGALVAFLFVALNVGILYVVPRYFMVSAALAALPVAVLGARWLEEGGPRRNLAILAGLGFVATSLVLLDLENTHPMFAEQRIAEFVSASDTPVHVDPETARRLRYLLLVRGLLNRVSSDPPVSGSLVATEDGVVQACLGAPGCLLHERMLRFAPGPGWTEVARYEPPRRSIAGLLELVGLKRFVPADIWRKIERPGVAGVVYRVAG
ncbi:MAG: ArnT family glycosyltransferase [Nevskiales bacterium]